MPQKFDSTFKQMYQVGKPDVRKYNSALQAMFWLFEDGKAKVAIDITVWLLICHPDGDEGYPLQLRRFFVIISIPM